MPPLLTIFLQIGLARMVSQNLGPAIGDGIGGASSTLSSPRTSTTYNVTGYDGIFNADTLDAHMALNPLMRTASIPYNYMAPSVAGTHYEGQGRADPCSTLSSPRTSNAYYAVGSSGDFPVGSRGHERMSGMMAANPLMAMEADRSSRASHMAIDSQASPFILGQRPRISQTGSAFGGFWPSDMEAALAKMLHKYEHAARSEGNTAVSTPGSPCGSTGSVPKLSKAQLQLQSDLVQLLRTMSSRASRPQTRLSMSGMRPPQENLPRRAVSPVAHEADVTVPGAADSMPAATSSPTSPVKPKWVTRAIDKDVSPIVVVPNQSMLLTVTTPQNAAPTAVVTPAPATPAAAMTPFAANTATTTAAQPESDATAFLTRPPSTEPSADPSAEGAALETIMTTVSDFSNSDSRSSRLTPCGLLADAPNGSPSSLGAGHDRIVSTEHIHEGRSSAGSAMSALQTNYSFSSWKTLPTDDSNNSGTPPSALPNHMRLNVARATQSFTGGTAAKPSRLSHINDGRQLQPEVEPHKKKGVSSLIGRFKSMGNMDADGELRKGRSSGSFTGAVPHGQTSQPSEDGDSVASGEHTKTKKSIFNKFKTGLKKVMTGKDKEGGSAESSPSVSRQGSYK